MSLRRSLLAKLARGRLESNADLRRLAGDDALERYRYDPAAYISEKLGWQPWSGTDAQPGQRQVLGAYTLALRQQHERDAFEQGGLSQSQLEVWEPGQQIQNHLRIEAGHTIGKTKVASGIVNHFFDCFSPSIIYSFAPSRDQVHDLLWKEIKADRRGAGLPGRILDLRLERSPDHFAIGRATNNSGGTGTERIQGQHGKYLLFVLDEAEGIADFVWDAVKSMSSGGISMVLSLANPRTRSSRFAKARELASVRSFRISCIWHPNVLEGREVVPGAVRRDYVDSMLDEHCARVTVHDVDRNTFEVPWRPGLVFQPDAEMLFRVLGIAPGNISDNTLVPIGLYEAATHRSEIFEEHPTIARMGVDVARFGTDMGTLYARHNGQAWRVARFAQLDTTAYAIAIVEEARRLRGLGVTSLRIRVDGGGGFGGGVIDQLAHDQELLEAWAGLDFQVLEVHFNAVPYDTMAYADLATEMYAEAAETLKRLSIADAPPELEADLCERTYTWMNRQGVAVKRLEPKNDHTATSFHKRLGRSPDDGDGFVLAIAPDFVFMPRGVDVATYSEPVEISPF